MKTQFTCRLARLMSRRRIEKERQNDREVTFRAASSGPAERQAQLYVRWSRASLPVCQSVSQPASQPNRQIYGSAKEAYCLNSARVIVDGARRSWLRWPQNSLISKLLLLPPPLLATATTTAHVSILPTGIEMMICEPSCLAAPTAADAIVLLVAAKHSATQRKRA